jgi:hypothetical protein
VIASRSLLVYAGGVDKKPHKRKRRWTSKELEAIEHKGTLRRPVAAVAHRASGG